jgi:hypothetical protein
MPHLAHEQAITPDHPSTRVTVFSGGAKPVVTPLNGGRTAATDPGMVAVIMDLYLAGGRMIFTDRATLNAVTKVLNRTGDYKAKKAAQVITYMTKVPMAYQSVVLTDALASKYWAPTGCNTLSGWMAAFGMPTSPPATGAIRALIERASDGTMTMFPAALSEASVKGLFDSLRAGKKSSIDAYRKINSHMEMWGAVQRTDRHLRSSFLRTGDVVKVTPFKCHGGIIEATATTPFKLRPGSSVFVFNDTDGLEATLLDLGFDNETQSLTARFTNSTGFGGDRRKRSGYDMLADPARRGTEFWVTSAPFQANNRGGSRSTRANGGGDTVVRELPLYVSLAAAAG